MNDLTMKFYLWLIKDKFKKRLYVCMSMFPNFNKYWTPENTLEMFIEKYPEEAISDAKNFFEKLKLDTQQVILERYRKEVVDGIDKEEQEQLELAYAH